MPGIAYRNPRDRTQPAVGLSTIVHGIGSRKDIEPNLQIDAGVMSLRPVFGRYDAAIPGTWARSRGSWMRMTRELVTSPRPWRRDLRTVTPE